MGKGVTEDAEGTTPSPSLMAAQPLNAWQGLKTTDDGDPDLVFHMSWMAWVGSEGVSDN